MEKTELAAVVPLNCGWSDLGSWLSLWRRGVPDPNENVISGDVIVDSVKKSYLHNENGPLVAAVGLSDVVVVATRDAVLLASKDQASEVRNLVDRLAKDGREEALCKVKSTGLGVVIRISTWDRGLKLNG